MIISNEDAKLPAEDALDEHPEVMLISVAIALAVESLKHKKP